MTTTDEMTITGSDATSHSAHLRFTVDSASDRWHDRFQLVAYSDGLRRPDYAVFPRRSRRAGNLSCTRCTVLRLRSRTAS